MGTLPRLIPPQINTPLQTWSRLSALRGADQQYDLQAQEIAQQKQQQAELQKLQQSILQASKLRPADSTDYDPIEKGLELYEQSGGNLQISQKIREGREKERTARLAQSKEEREVKKEQKKLYRSGMKALKSLPPEKRPSAYPIIISQLGITKAPPQYPGDEMLDFLDIALADDEKLDDFADKQEARQATARENELNRAQPTAGMKEFDAWFADEVAANKYKNDALGRSTARIDYDKRQKQRVPVPGVDVPLPADVEAQRNRMRPEQTVVMQTVDDEGNAVRRIVPKTAGAEYAAGPTADMRNKEVARQKLLPAFGALEELGKKVITEKLSIVQRAKASGRAVDAALADDAEYRTYQDARQAFALQLAVATQGSRPSDTDMIALLNLIPDVFKDTTLSAKMKWDMLRTQMQIKGALGGPQGGQGTVKMRAPNGKEQDVPADQVDHYKAKGAVVVKQ